MVSADFEAFVTEQFKRINDRLGRLENAVLGTQPPEKIGDWIGVSIQCVPYEEIDRRVRAGEPGLSTIHGLNERSHTYYPASVARQESLTAKAMLDFLDPMPEGTIRKNGPVFRDFVNTGQLTENGEYTGPGRERFMRDWIANGGRVMFVNAALHNESPSYPIIEQGPQACLDWMHQAGAQGVEAMRRIVRLIKRLTVDEQRSVVAVETMNEPAIYDKMGRQVWGDAGITELDALDAFERDQAEIARTALAEGLPSHMLILFPRYKYNADAQSLLAKNGRTNSILDRWKAEFGNRLGISMHMYSPWVSGSYTGDWKKNAIEKINQIQGVPQVVTETNSSDFRASERGSSYHHSGWTLAEISTETGVAFQYFPGANWGQGALFSSRFSPDRTNEPDRMFVWYDLLSRTLRPEPIDVLIPVHVVRSNTDPRGNDADHRIRDGLRVYRTGDQDGRWVMSGTAAIMAYGGEGEQHITMNPDEFSWFSGGPGNDTVDASKSPGCIVNLGEGDDTIILGGDHVTVHGRGGGDTYVLSDKGTAHVFGFNPAEDRIKPNGVKYSVTTDKDHSYVTSEGGGVVHLHGLKGGKALRDIQAAILKE